MKIARTLLPVAAALAAGMALGVAIQAAHHDPARPAEITRADMRGAAFERDDVQVIEHGSHTTADVTSLMSSDGRFGSGLYRSGKVRFEITEPYGVDEFMYFIDGGVTLTSGDGSVQTIEAGEAVTIPREWTGVWDTEGYTKIWVIYSADGSGLQ